MNSKKYKDSLYCHKCKKFIKEDDEEYTGYYDSQGFHRCPICLDVGYQITVLHNNDVGDVEKGFHIEVQDEMTMYFSSAKDFNQFIRTAKKLINNSGRKIK